MSKVFSCCKIKGCTGFYRLYMSDESAIYIRNWLSQYHSDIHTEDVDSTLACSKCKHIELIIYSPKLS